MGAQTIVRKGTRLAAALAAAGTSITVTNAGSTGLNYVAGDSVRIIGNEDLPFGTPPSPVVVNLVDADTNATVVSNFIDGFDAPGASEAVAAGAVILNMTDAALVENTDYVMDYEKGMIRLINGALVAGDTYGVQTQAQRAAKTIIKLGKFKPQMEMSLRLVHRFNDGRELRYIAPRVAIAPENPQLNFDDSDWIGADLLIEVLATDDPQYEDEPFGRFEIEHNKTTGQEDLGLNPASYSVGSFRLYVTPLDALTAAQHGFTQSEIDIGNVRVGTVEANNEFLRHYRDIPRVKDKVIKIQSEMNITATIENLNSHNFALMFEGERVVDNSTATYGDVAALVTVPADIATAAGQARWIPLGARALNPA